MGATIVDADFKVAMDALCSQYKSDEALTADPISITGGYKSSVDKELASWVAAHLAYGRVGPMLRAIRRLLEPLGHEPALWLRERPEQRVRAELSSSLRGWVWRFHVIEDMANWILAWKQMDSSTGYSGIEPLLLPGSSQTADQRISSLIHSLRNSLPKTQGIRFNLPDPLKGAAAKRWRMFLRWMVRKGWPDFGIWRKYPASELIIPLDTHVHRISRQIGLCARRSQDGKAAHEITNALKKLDQKDPLKYDFALAHLGILGDCNGKRREACKACPLDRLCMVRH
ncbi:MAG: TIGR02757 family protein [Holophagaceae bacterium]|nr:TIGR02757 family protein [Holophagaceae bacterium]